MKDYEQTWEEFWKGICTKDGEVNLEQVKRELHDYKTLLHNVPIVYDHITGGRISKPFTDPKAVTSVADDYYETLHICNMPHGY